MLSQTGLSSAEPAFRSGADEGVSGAMTDLEKQLVPRSGKLPTAEIADDTALSIELSVRNVTSQVKRFKAYFKNYPDEVKSGRATTLFTKAHNFVVRLDAVAKPTVSHADRILMFAKEIDISIPAIASEVAALGN